MQELNRTITVPGHGEVSSRWIVPPGYRSGEDSGVILAHGAGTDMHDAFLSYVHRALASRGLLSVKFNFPYKERGGRAPDRPLVLEATWRAVFEAVRCDVGLAPRRLFLGGKSMGGRIASQVAAAGEPCAGLVLLGYPLHPAGRPEHLRTAHLSQIACPLLFVQGTRDRLCDLGLLAEAVRPLAAPVTVHRIEEADHSFRLPKRAGRPPQHVWQEIVDTVAVWIGAQSHTAAPA